MSNLDSITLFFQEETSDKLYNAQIVEVDGLYSVTVQWGRRGRKLSEGHKALRVPLEQAQKAFDKVIRQKKRKGYEVWTDTVKPAAVAPAQGLGSGSRAGIHRRVRLGGEAQLLNPIAASAVEGMLTDDGVLAQQKLDGKRVVVHVLDTVQAANRRGESTTLDPSISAALSHLPAGTILDGELVPGDDGPTYWVFDLLAHANDDLTTMTYAQRSARLASLGNSLTTPIALVGSATTTDEKRALLARLEKNHAEGIVFKHTAAPYTPGRPASGGTQLKHKFIKTADVIITANTGNAYQMAVMDGTTLREVGKVFAGTTNASRKQLDAALAAGTQPIAEVRYLYATETDILYQPVYARERSDKTAEECTLSQLVHTNRGVVAAQAPQPMV